MTHEAVGEFTSVWQSTFGEGLILNEPPVHMALLDAAYRDAQSVGAIVHIGLEEVKSDLLRETWGNTSV